MDTSITTRNDKLKLDYSWDEFPVHFGVFKSLRCFSCLCIFKHCNWLKSVA